MYAAKHVAENPERPAFIMASTGDSVSYAEYEGRSNLPAHLLRAHGLERLDHYSVFMENNDRYLETCGAGERAGLFYTRINSYLTADEVAYIIENSDTMFSRMLKLDPITHPKVADAAVFGVPNELIDSCATNLSRQKVPRSIDFDPELRRLPTGKLYKRVLRDRYWGEGQSRILST